MEPRSSRTGETEGELRARLAEIERLLNSDPAQRGAGGRPAPRGGAGRPDGPAVPGHRAAPGGPSVSPVEVLERLCRDGPEAPLSHLQLGLARRALGHNKAAAEAMRRAAAIRPDSADAWLALADLLTEITDRDGADHAFGRYLEASRQDPGLAGPAAVLRENRIADAAAMLKGRLERQPNDIAAISLLADVSTRQAHLDEARALLELAPSYSAARHTTRSC